MKVAIYGAGSLGTVLGAYITKTGYDIDLINKNVKHITSLKEKGATITGSVNFNQKVSALLVEEMKEKYDIIFLATKQQHNKEVAEYLKGYMNEGGVIVTLQNGLPELLLSEVLGEESVLSCIVGWGATLHEGGVSELTSSPDALYFTLGSFSTKVNAHFEDVKKLLETMGVVEIVENFVGARWSKILVNSAFSGMSAICGCTFGEVVDNKVARKIVQALIKECIDVSRAGGIKIEPIQGKDVVKLLDYKNPFKKWLSYIIIPIAIKKHRLLKASMLQDLQKGVPCEVDGINGVICKFGKKVNCPTPYNDKVVSIIKKIESKELTSSFDNLKYFG